MKFVLTLFYFSLFSFLIQAQTPKPVAGANTFVIKTGQKPEEAFKTWEKHLEQNGFKIDRSYLDVLTLSTVAKEASNKKYVYLINTAVAPTGDVAVKLQWQDSENLFTGTKEVNYNSWEYSTAKTSPAQLIYQDFLKIAQSFGKYPIEVTKN